MKKIYSLFCLLCITAVCAAQMQLNPTLLHPTKTFGYDKTKMLKQNNPLAKTTAIINQGWFNYGRTAETVYGVSSDLNSNYLFPDSSGYGEYGTGNFQPCWVHHLAELVNFNSLLFSLDPATSWIGANGNAAFEIDSMSIFYAYTRNHPNPNIVDTLIVTVFDNTSPTNFSLTAFTGATATNYGTDTLSFQLLGYNSASNLIAIPNSTLLPTSYPVGQYKFKVLLNGSDSAVNIYREKKFALPVPFSSNGGKLVVADVMFKPGYTYTVGEHITTNANAFYFTSLEENGNGGFGGTFMNYLDCNYGSAQCDNSASYIIPQDVRYNMASSWNYRYIPAYAYTMAYGFEHHLISFHLTDTVAVPCQVTSQFSVFADSLNPGNYYAYNNSTGTGTLSYLWDFGDGTTSNQPYPLHNYAIPGQYIICLSVSGTSGTNTCTNTYCDSSSVNKQAAGFLMSQFNVISQTATQLSNTEIITGIKAYPNPVDEQLNVELSINQNQHLHYTLTDALGRSVANGELNTGKTNINTAGLAKGFYSLSITNQKGNKLKTIKLMK